MPKIVLNETTNSGGNVQKFDCPGFNRRHFCSFLISGAAMLHAGLLRAGPAASRRLDFANEADRLRALIKMRGSLDSQLVIGWLRAKRFAVSNGRVEPLCGVLAATLYRFGQVSDDLCEAVALEITYYTDLATGELLESIVMPFSGEQVAVPIHRFGPTTTRFAVRLEEQEDFEPAAGTTQDQFAPAASVRMSKSIAPGYVRDDDLFLRHEEYGRVYPADSSIPNMFYKESTIWSAPLQDVLDERTSNVDARVGYSAMTSWRPWMQMGDVPGFTSSNGFGGKVRSLEDLPDDYLRFTERTNPDVLEDPEALLDALKE